MRIEAVDHVQITVPGDRVDEARRFYIETLGLSELPKPDSLIGRGGFWMSAGNTPVHLGVEPGVDRAATKAHVAYLVDDLAAWRKRLAREGVDAIDGVPIPGLDRFEFRDPFGNRVEMIQRSERS